MKKGGIFLLKLENTKPFSFFAAANSGKGFVSFFEEIFNSKEMVKRYLIKGGPGTGKSSFMRRVASEAEKKGRKVVYYHCSSDPSSLDGIIIDSKIALIDSTSPHATEPSFVGAKDSIVDLGVFWDCGVLEKRMDEISSLTEKKRHSYALAYRFLSSAMQSEIASREILLPYVDMSRIEKTARRLTCKIKRGEEYYLKIGLSSAIGTAGRCELQSYEQIAKQTVYIEDAFGFGCLLLSKLCEFAAKNQNKISVSYQPLCPDLPDAVLFEEEGVAFVLCKERKHKNQKQVSLRRVLKLNNITQKEKLSLRARSRNAKKLSDALIIAACDELALAGEAHFELEEIYRQAMDFSALNAFFEGFVRKI